MNLVDIVLLILIIALVVFCGYKGLGHFRGEGGCCGGGGTSIIEDDKNLDNPIIGKYDLHIEGMHCENCAVKIKRIINKTQHASGIVSLKNKNAIVSYDQDIDIDEIINKINAAGYTATKK